MVDIMKIKKIKLSWGELIIVGRTKKFSIGIDIIFPGKETDKEGTYLKKGDGIYYVLAGEGLCGTRQIKKGDVLEIKTGQKINLKNNFSENLIVMTIYMPPYNEANIGYKEWTLFLQQKKQEKPLWTTTKNFILTRSYSSKIHHILKLSISSGCFQDCHIYTSLWHNNFSLIHFKSD